jgi:hypothetical protein
MAIPRRQIRSLRVVGECESAGHRTGARATPVFRRLAGPGAPARAKQAETGSHGIPSPRRYALCKLEDFRVVYDVIDEPGEGAGNERGRLEERELGRDAGDRAVQADEHENRFGPRRRDRRDCELGLQAVALVLG